MDQPHSRINCHAAMSLSHTSIPASHDADASLDDLDELHDHNHDQEDLAYACIDILDFDLVPRADGEGVEIARRIIKAVNLTPYNYTKHGMNLTALEFIFERYEERPDEETGG